VLIEKAQLNFSPAYLDLVNLKMNIGGNDLSAKGKIENFLPYIFSDGTLTGKLETGSGYFNLSELMPESPEPQNELPSQEIPPEGPADTLSVTSIEIPGNINFSLNSNFKQLIYDGIEMKNVSGVIFIRDKAIILNKLRMDILDGTCKLSGKFDTQTPEKPKAEMDIDIANINIQKAYTTFGMIEKLMPIAEKTEGTFSTTLTFNTLLDNELMPVYNTMNGNGKLKTSTITIAGINTLNKLADILKMPDLKRIKSDPVNLTYEFSDGRLRIEPFDIKYQDIKANIGGSTGFDQTIDYDMKLAVPRDKFGGQANAILDNLIARANNLGTNFSVGETVDINVKIGGTITNPQLKTGLAGGSGNMKEDLKKRALEELEKQKQKLEEEARKELEKKRAEAKAKADKILADAKKESDKVMADAQNQVNKWNKEAESLAQQAKDEAKNQADKLMEEAKKNGPLAEMAAKVTTDKLLGEANKNADKLVAEAKAKSENLLFGARKQADKINADAQQRANDLLKAN
jgi:vacuolar-type H+-ATPase subunit H